MQGKLLLDQFSRLSEKDQARVLQLHHNNPEAGLQDRLLAIFAANTIESAPAAALCLYPTIPRINHSCRPSLVWSWQAGQPLTKQVRAVRRVPAGEELCACYIDSYQE